MTRKLAELAGRYALDEERQRELLALLKALERDPHAPTSVRDRDRALDVHVADSLVALELDAVRSARRVADIGAGAGFPGLVLAIALRDAELRLVESQSRRCAFLEDLRASLALCNVEVVCARVEDWRAGADAHDVVSARALAPQPVVLEYAAPLLRPGGVLVDWRGAREPEQERAAQRAAAELGLALEEVRRVRPYEGVRDHHLHVFRKVAQTPERFPRRAGVARKRPLGR